MEAPYEAPVCLELPALLLLPIRPAVAAASPLQVVPPLCALT